LSAFATAYNPAIPYGTYVPYIPPDDAELLRGLEEDILWDWIQQDSDDLPPEFSEAESNTTKRPWNPASVAQQMALECEADILLYGGSAGSLKSETLLVDAVIEVENPNYNGIIFRQSFPELRDLVKKSLRLYPQLGGTFVKGSPMCWTFPSGATLWLGYMGHDDDVFAHQGNEYSFIGFDEAGHQNEHRIRYMLTRLRATDKSLKLRMRLTANPGGPGHAFLMKMFLRGVCPHCEPTKAVIAGKLYSDAVWPSDKQPLTVTLPGGKVITRTVAFIPGKVTDHNLLGDEYVANLMTQAASTAKKLLDGCWKEWEGQFFDCFMETRGIIRNANGTYTVPEPDMRMVVPRQEVDIKYWYPHFVGGDYGFSGSSAAAHLLVRTPATTQFKNGRVYVIEEYIEPGVTARDYGKDLVERWFLEADPRTGELVVPDKARSIQMWAVSPDAYRKDGVVNDVDVAFSRYEQMNESLAPYGMGFVRANDDRKGGWMKVYQMLRDGELVICAHCRETIDALQTRLRDPKKGDDLLKVAGDPLDDLVDSLRYAIMTWQMYASKPRQEVIAEAIQGLDPTNAMMTVRKFEIEERRSLAAESYSPKAVRGRRQW
jgi:hypothetical protein